MRSDCVSIIMVFPEKLAQLTKIVLGRLLCILGWHHDVCCYLPGCKQKEFPRLDSFYCTTCAAFSLKTGSKSRGAISWSYSTNRPEEMRLVSTLSRIQNQQVGRNLGKNCNRGKEHICSGKDLNPATCRFSQTTRPPNNFPQIPQIEKFFRAEAYLQALIGTS